MTTPTTAGDRHHQRHRPKVFSQVRSLSSLVQTPLLTPQNGAFGIEILIYCLSIRP
jgi:hypothetical protein